MLATASRSWAQACTGVVLVLEHALLVLEGGRPRPVEPSGAPERARGQCSAGLRGRRRRVGVGIHHRVGGSLTIQLALEGRGLFEPDASAAAGSAGFGITFLLSANLFGCGLRCACLPGSGYGLLHTGQRPYRTSMRSSSSLVARALPCSRRSTTSSWIPGRSPGESGTAAAGSAGAR